MVVLGNLNGRIGDGVRDGVTGSFSVLGENDFEMKVVDFCSGRNLFVTNTFF